jgi:hypothetical protein
MAIRNRNQRDAGMVGEALMSGSGAQRKIICAQECQRYFFDTDTWYKFDHSNPESPAHEAIADEFVVIEGAARGIKIEGSDLFVQHDMPGRENGSFRWTREQYAANAIWPCQATALWLDAARSKTNCDAVTIYF